MEAKKKRTGANGKDLIIKIPVGTQIYEEDNNTLIYDFTKNKERYLVAAGGKHGLGNVESLRVQPIELPQKKQTENLVKNLGLVTTKGYC